MFGVLIQEIIVIAVVFGLFYLVSALGGKSQNLITGSSRGIGWLAPSTIVHELSHLIFHLVFLNHVTKVVLFNPTPDENGGYTLGHVDYAYSERDERSIIKQTSFLLAGLAPVFGISAIILFSFYGLFPNASAKVIADVLNTQDGLVTITFNILKDVLFNTPSFSGVLHTIIFVIELALLAPGYHLSDADINSGKKAWFPLIVISFIVSVIVEMTLPELAGSFSVLFHGFLVMGIIVILIQLSSNLILSFLKK